MVFNLDKESEIYKLAYRFLDSHTGTLIWFNTPNELLDNKKPISFLYDDEEKAYLKKTLEDAIKFWELLAREKIK